MNDCERFISLSYKRGECILKKNSTYTSSRKQAYEFASLIQVCEGVEEVSVQKTIDDTFLIKFICNSEQIEKEVAYIILEFNFDELLFYGNGVIQDVISK
ncbi:hypothetical protein D3C87_624280 [compost metagenome]